MEALRDNVHSVSGWAFYVNLTPDRQTSGWPVIRSELGWRVPSSAPWDIHRQRLDQSPIGVRFRLSPEPFRQAVVASCLLLSTRGTQDALVGILR
jgi:hypothetical protein